MVQTRAKATKDKVKMIEISGASVSDEHHIETYLNRVTTRFCKIKDELEGIRERNRQLQDALNKGGSTHSRKPSTHGSKPVHDGMKVRELQLQIKELEKARKKDRKMFDQIWPAEVQKEPCRLNNSGEEDGGGDADYKRMKLLRKFCDLMLVITLEGDRKEQCPVCLQDLETSKTSGFPCEHMVCNICLSGISQGSDKTFTCPVCSLTCEHDDIELVHMTEAERWDMLTEIANAASFINRRGTLKPTDEENEENFKNSPDGTDTSENQFVLKNGVISDSAIASLETTREGAYLKWPSPVKRMQLLELGRSRAKRRRV